MIVAADGSLVEAESMGVTQSPITKYREGEYRVVRLGSGLTPDRRATVVAYAQRQVGAAFGYLDLAGACLHLIFGLPLRWVRRNHEICSSLVVKALQEGDQLCDFDPPTTLPADLAKAFDVQG